MRKVLIVVLVAFAAVPSCDDSCEEPDCTGLVAHVSGEVPQAPDGGDVLTTCLWVGDGEEDAQ